MSNKFEPALLLDIVDCARPFPAIVLFVELNYVRAHSSLLLFDFFRRLYDYRDYLSQSVLRDLRIKYKRSALGYIWTMLHPLCMMAIIAVVFSHIMQIPIRDYAIFLFAGLLPWNYFNSTVMMSLVSMRSNARLFSHVPIPKYIFVISLAFSNLANLFFAIVPLIIIMLAFGHSVPWTVLALPAMILPLFFMVVGVSLLLATSNVFFDDTLHLSEVGLQALYFLCPILYQRQSLPAGLGTVLSYNPLFGQIEFIRGIFYSGQLPDPTLYAVNVLVSILVLNCGLYVFCRNQDKFIYFI